MRAEQFIRTLAARVQALGGWRRRGAAFAAGSLSVLAMAPFFAWPVLWITLPVLVWLIDGAVARRRHGLAPFAEGSRGRLVVRLRLFPVRAVLDRRGLPRRGRGVRGPAAGCRDAAAGRPGAVLRRSHGTCLTPMEAWVEPRPGACIGSVGDGMAAWPCADWLSLERARLRADLPAAPDAERGRARHLWPDAVRGGHLRAAAGALE